MATQKRTVTLDIFIPGASELIWLPRRVALKDIKALQIVLALSELMGVGPAAHEPNPPAVL